MLFAVTGSRTWNEAGWDRVVQFPAFTIEAASRTEALLKLGTVLHTTMTETTVSVEEV